MSINRPAKINVQLAPVPQWLDEAGVVQQSDVCWSSRVGWRKRIDGDRHPRDYELSGLEQPYGMARAYVAYEIVVCPACADAILDKSDRPNGVRTSQGVPFATRQAQPLDRCDLCEDAMTVFLPDLGGWVVVYGSTALPTSVWQDHLDELTPPTIKDLAWWLGEPWLWDIADWDSTYAPAATACDQV